MVDLPHFGEVELVRDRGEDFDNCEGFFLFRSKLGVTIDYLRFLASNQTLLPLMKGVNPWLWHKHILGRQVHRWQGILGGLLLQGWKSQKLKKGEHEVYIPSQNRTEIGWWWSEGGDCVQIQHGRSYLCQNTYQVTFQSFQGCTCIPRFLKVPVLLELQKLFLFFQRSLI